MLPFRSGCRTSIYRQIVLIGTIPPLIMAAVAAGVLYQWNIRYNHQMLELQGRLLTTQLAGALEYVLAIDAKEQLAAVVNSTIKPATQILDIPISEVTVTDQAGQIVYRFAPPTDRERPRPARADSTAPAGETMRFSADIVLQPMRLGNEAETGPRKIGQTNLHLSLGAAVARWHQKMLFDLGVVCLIFGLATGTAYSVGRRLSRAIRKVTHAIKAIENGQLSTRLSKTDDNELGTLQGGVNMLAETLQEGKTLLESELDKVRGEYQNAMGTLERVNQDLEQAIEAKSLFLAKMSHEMRTPMYTVLGAVAELMREEDDINKLRVLSNIHAASKNVNRQVDDILQVISLTKKQAEGEKLAAEAVQVVSLIETLAAQPEPLMIRDRLYMDLIVGDNVPPTVKSNNKALREIVSNLIGNAVKYTQSGGVTVQVERFNRAPTDPTGPPILLKLSVADTGCGIPEDKQKTIFNEFAQLDEAYNRRHGGTGLGLSIVKKNCELLGGRISVESESGRGATFTVELPVYPCDEPPSLRTTVMENSLPAGWTALVADERASFRASISSRLNGLNIVTKEQAMAVDALASTPIPSQFFDGLVVQNLNALDPQSLPKIIRGLRRWAHLLISFETNHSLENQRRLRQAGVDVVLWSGTSRDHIKEALLSGAPQKPAPVTPAASELLSGTTVLLVDDEEINRTIVANQLKRNGARVLEADGADTAIAMAAEPSLSIILMDIQMPGKDGMAAIQEIRRLSHCAHLTIAGFTAFHDTRTLERILQAGADATIPKLLDEPDFIKEVYALLKRTAPASLAKRAVSGDPFN